MNMYQPKGELLLLDRNCFHLRLLGSSGGIFKSKICSRYLALIGYCYGVSRRESYGSKLSVDKLADRHV